MSNYVQNYGFTKTLVKDNGRKIKNEIKWVGDYDGKMANIYVDVNDNGNKQHVNMQLDNNDLRNLLGIQPINMSLDQRLYNDFLHKPITLEGALKKTRRHKRKHRHHKKRKTHKQKY
jgi:hypothetical protein